jgi:hypothetical protein
LAAASRAFAALRPSNSQESPRASANLLLLCGVYGLSTAFARLNPSSPNRHFLPKSPKIASNSGNPPLQFTSILPGQELGSHPDLMFQLEPYGETKT